MVDYESKRIFYITASLIVCSLMAFTNLNKTTIITIGLCIGLIILFYHIFKRDGSKQLKFMIILLIYIVIPLYTLMYFGILNYFANPLGGIVIAFMMVIIVCAAFYTGFKLNLIDSSYFNYDN